MQSQKIVLIGVCLDLFPYYKPSFRSCADHKRMSKCVLLATNPRIKLLISNKQLHPSHW